MLTTSVSSPSPILDTTAKGNIIQGINTPWVESNQDGLSFVNGPHRFYSKLISERHLNGVYLQSYTCPTWCSLWLTQVLLFSSPESRPKLLVRTGFPWPRPWTYFVYRTHYDAIQKYISRKYDYIWVSHDIAVINPAGTWKAAIILTVYFWFIYAHTPCFTGISSLSGQVLSQRVSESWSWSHARAWNTARYQLLWILTN